MLGKHIDSGESMDKSQGTGSRAPRIAPLAAALAIAVIAATGCQSGNPKVTGSLTTAAPSAAATTAAAPVAAAVTTAPVPQATTAAPVAPVAPATTPAYTPPPAPVYTPPPAPAATLPPVPAGDGTYTNVDGNTIPDPVSAAAPPAGATAQCNDGTYSFSQHHSGTCSSHGGVARWL